ncbi:CD209 antigen-like isoform X1 [Hippocampus comes]|uniref:CD209 antigen-like n=2 Tax=Hippocampus comes TaxID=109280 RepID=A0A3Q2Y231_HIPCM|nr:PREDICTED: CD209 antigen-like isoform X1 [Hippocampus comes]XP_019745045.1 PREDICTED: CD209 antigen-like isoform X1 [Hippocampus comes]
MTVKYQTSTETAMDIDDGNGGYKHLIMNGSKLKYSVYALRNSPFRAATLILGLMCVVLVAGVIGQSVHYWKVGKDNQRKLEVVGGEKDKLQSQLKTVQNEKKNLDVSHEHLQQSYNFIYKRTNQIQANNDLLKSEANQLKDSQSKLQASNAALKKDLEQLKSSQEQLQTNNDALSTAKDLLQTKYESIGKSKNVLQANYDSVIKERDNLQNKFNNVTRSKEKLQMSYNVLIKDIEHLQVRYTSSSNERDTIASSHQNLTLEKETLQAIYTTLAKATDELMASYNSTVEEKMFLESRLKNVTAERDLQRVEISNMSAEVEQLRATVTRLNATIKDKVCQSGWKKFENSCYFTSTSKKTWYLSRNYCQGKGADLVIINSKAEMVFINGLFSINKEVWIGLTDEGVEGQWKWVDGTAMTLSYWADGQPNSYNGNQDCGEFWYRSSGNAEWNDEKCSSQRYWVCEM